LFGSPVSAKGGVTWEAIELQDRIEEMSTQALRAVALKRLDLANARMTTGAWVLSLAPECANWIAGTNCTTLKETTAGVGSTITYDASVAIASLVSATIIVPALAQNGEFACEHETETTAPATCRRNLARGRRLLIPSRLLDVQPRSRFFADL
jgi:hypothetical protein